MDMDFAISCPLVRRSRLVSGSCPSTRTFDPCFFQTPPRDGSPCIISSPSPPSGWAGTFTLKLLNMLSTQRSRWAAGARVALSALWRLADYPQAFDAAGTLFQMQTFRLFVMLRLSCGSRRAQCTPSHSCAYVHSEGSSAPVRPIHFHAHRPPSVRCRV